MREIKFRGKRVDNGEWVYGMLDCIYKEDSVTTISYLDKEDYYCEDKVIPETTGQFTGLVDKNGKEIYEGDIIKGFTAYGEYDDLGIITYDNAKFNVGINGHEYYDYVCGFIAKVIDDEKNNTDSPHRHRSCWLWRQKY